MLIHSIEDNCESIAAEVHLVNGSYTVRLFDTELHEQINIKRKFKTSNDARKFAFRIVFNMGSE